MKKSWPLVSLGLWRGTASLFHFSSLAFLSRAGIPTLHFKKRFGIKVTNGGKKVMITRATAMTPTKGRM